MSQKYFNVNKPQDVVTIVEDKEQFYELSDGNMIKKETFEKKYQPVLEGFENETKTINTGNDVVDPEQFFSSIPTSVIDGIKGVDSSKLQDGGTSEVRHNTTDQVTKKAPSVNESLVKPVEQQTIPNNTNTDVSNYKVYENDDDAYEDFVKKNQGQHPTEQPKPQQKTDLQREKEDIERLFDDEKLALGEEEAIQRRMKRLKKLSEKEQKELEQPQPTSSNTESTTYQQPQQTIDPIEMMFSTFKRNHNIKFNVIFEDKIANPDFIKLMIENMDGDIVGFYKKRIMSNIMQELDKIEKVVEETIKKEIFGEEETIDEEKEIVSKSKKTAKDIKKRKDEGRLESLKEDVKLVPGGKTKTGKQKYKYLDEEGNVKELLPESAKKKGYQPYIEEKK